MSGRDENKTAELIRRARDGVEGALGSLLNHYRTYLLLLARLQISRRLQSKASDSDLVQETLLEAHRCFSDFRGGTEPELLAWLRQILCSRLSMLVRRFSTQRRTVALESQLRAELDQSADDLQGHLAAHSDTPSREAVRHEQGVLLARALYELPSDYREAIILHHFEGLPFDQIASRMRQNQRQCPETLDPGTREAAAHHGRPIMQPPTHHGQSPTHSGSSVSESSISPVDAEVVKLVEEFHTALAAGQRPDRRKLLEAFPTIAEELDAVLDGLELVDRAVPAVMSGAERDAEFQPAQGQLGDFRLIREIGRGGMGVVYEAEQISLGRRVALKVLPFAAMLDQRRLQRFQNEARAAASLKHQNIVQAYWVGCERGVHFYAMEYVEGENLASVIDRLRHTPRSDLGRAVASHSETLDLEADTAAARATAAETTRQPKATISTASFPPQPGIL